MVQLRKSEAQSAWQVKRELLMFVPAFNAVFLGLGENPLACADGVLEKGQAVASSSSFDFFIAPFLCWSLRTASRRTAHCISCGPLRLQVTVSDWTESDHESESIVADPNGDAPAIDVSEWIQLQQIQELDCHPAIDVEADLIATN